jgi:hypothetical protein
MANPNKFRRETDLVLNGHTYSCRPTMDKLARIESRFGAALPLLRRVGDGGATQAELTAIVQIMLRGVHNAPRDADVAPLIFDQGAITVAGNIVDFIASGITSDAPPKEEGEGEREAEGNP